VKSLRILIAEDEAVIAMLLDEVLTGLGHTICASVPTADEAIAAARQHHPDLVIADAGLRDSSGVEAIATIIATGNIPHIFMSGNVAAVLALRPDAVVIEKPFHEAELVAAIARAISA
jgi:CheY-like chemotaxis protein